MSASDCAFQSFPRKREPMNTARAVFSPIVVMGPRPRGDDGGRVER